MHIIILCFVAYLFFAVIIYLKLNNYTSYTVDLTHASELSKVAVLIPFRNEVENLPSLLSCIDNQQSNHQIKWIFIDDHSTDRGVDLVQNNSIFHYYSLPINKTGKKEALLWGLSCVEADYYIMIDTDVNFEDDWLNNIIEPMLNDKYDWIIGQVELTSENSNWLTKAQTLEWKALQRLTQFFALIGKPILCNGANLAFKASLKAIAIKALLNQTTASGDDLSLLNAFNKTKAIAGIGNTRSIVKTQMPASWNEFVQQKLRWAKKMQFQWSLTTLIGLVMVAMQITLIVLCFTASLKTVILSLFLKFVADSLIAKNSSILNFTYWLWLQIYPLILWLIQPFVRLQWKAREIKK
jgi:biofilm PGA synthesis N-glycosyltransferase PgaC